MWPFSSTPAFSPATDIGSLAGKVILVTGGNVGLGKETILQLAKHQPAKIFLAARTPSKAHHAVRDIKSSLSGTPGAADVDIEYLELDLASLKSVRAAAAAFNSKSSRLDILILNAGVMALPESKTESGHEIQLGTNHIGHFLLTKLLLPTMEKTATTRTTAGEEPDVRVITVSSTAYNLSPPITTMTSTEKLCAKGPWTRYGASKSANILFAAELARRCQRTTPNFHSVSIHPGVIQSDLWTSAKSSGSNFIVGYLVRQVSPYVFSDVPRGALNQLWAAAGAKPSELTNGGFYLPVGKLDKSNVWARDQDAARKLWDWTEKELLEAET